jgi:hypothetical protein
LRGFLDALDGLDGMDVVTAVVTDPGVGADTMLIMAFDLEDGFDPAELWAEKQRSRDEDRRALESGEKTIEQLNEENGVWGRVLATGRVNLRASKSLG